MNSSIALITTVSVLIQCVSITLLGQSINNVDKSKEHTIIIRRWEMRSQDKSPFLIEFDGKLLHENALALHDLDSLKFEDGSVIKVVLPPGPIPEKHFFKDSSFMHHAFYDGAKLVFYQGDNKLNYHVLMYQGLRLGPFSVVKKWKGGWNTDTAVYTLDGKKYFDGPSVASELKKLPHEDMLLFVLFPLGEDNFNNSRMGLTDKSEIDRCIELLRSKNVKLVSLGGSGFDSWPVPIFSD